MSNRHVAYTLSCLCMLALPWLAAETDIPELPAENEEASPTEPGTNPSEAFPHHDDSEKKEPVVETFDEVAVEPYVIPEGGVDVYVVPIEGPIGNTQLFILRRALKEAISNDVETVVLNMDTPGGRLDITLEMMEALDNFDGQTIVFVNDEAISAGSYISIACDYIYFSPKGKMGAAAVVSGTGEDVNMSMKQKIDSYLRAVVRTLSQKYRYRADVQRAMMDADFVLEIDGQVLKPKGELLTLTAEEAVTEYGDPPQPLLASGIVESVDELLEVRYGAENYQISTFEVNWSEEFAKWFESLAPLLFGIGVLLLIIEIKTPQFGLIGGLGIALIAVVFISNYFAGLAGYEALILFAIGVLLILAEVFFFPGGFVLAGLGFICVVASLVWSMADVWPTRDGGFTISTQALINALKDASLALAVCAFGL
ncbi:MAG: hypothetical protein AAGF10_06510, partial [Verrucomicrobiota bacterium]